jgi:hypothetical protein
MHPVRTGPGAGPGPRDVTATDVTSRPVGAARPSISALLFPTGEPRLPEAMHVNGERMDLRYVVGLLMEHRDTVHRLEAEAGATRD